MAKKYDYLWKGIVEDLFEDLLRFLYPDADKVFDLSKGVTFLDAELEQLFPPEDDEYAPKAVDKLVKLFTHAGVEEWALFHIEVQGQYRRDFAERMLRYHIRIFDKHNRPITAYAILTESNKKPRPDSYQHSFLGTQLIYRYNVLKIADLDDEKLFADENPFALAVLVAKTAFVGKRIEDRRERDIALLDAKRKLMQAMLTRNIPKDKIRSLIVFLTYYVNFEFKENNVIFEMEKKQLIGGSDTMGIEQLLIETEKKRSEKKGIEKGIEKGEEKKSYDVVENLIVKLGLSDEQAADIAEVSVDFVRNVRSALQKKK